MSLRIPILVAWMSLVSMGAASMLRYDVTSAQVDKPPTRWPVESAVSLGAARPTLLTFVHPHCPCSRASLEELREFAGRYHERMHLHVLMVRPEGVEGDWEQTALWDLAAAIPGATVRCDHDGREAARFRATASGESLLYDIHGRLQFHGGMTPLRGHRGDNAGIAALESLLVGEPARHSRSPVFGCELRDPAAKPQFTLQNQG